MNLCVLFMICGLACLLILAVPKGDDLTMGVKPFRSTYFVNRNFHLERLLQLLLENHACRMSIEGMENNSDSPSSLPRYRDGLAEHDLSHYRQVL